MEYWDAYDKFRKPLGYTIRRGDPIPKEARHLVVHVVLINSQGEVLVQRRADCKALAPGLWAFTGGSALAGETSEAACVRETEEELGFAPDMREAERIISFMRPNEFVDVYVVKTDVAVEEMRLQESEVAEVRWLGRDAFATLARDQKLFWQYRYMDMLMQSLVEDGTWNEA